ncbi:MAG: glycosyltransferase [Armatimonadota bacterium]
MCIIVNITPEACQTFSFNGLPCPRPTLRHLRRLTDDCGIIQHARFCCPDYCTGYCTDDNSRALIAVIRYNRWHYHDDADALMMRYLAFLHFTQQADGSMRNFVSYARTHLDTGGSQDCQGQALWALGEASAYPQDAIAHLAAEMFRRVLPYVTTDFPPHSLAYALLGLCAHAQYDHVYAQRAARPLAAALQEHYLRARADGWEWFLPILTYANGRLPQALLCAGQLLEDDTLRGIGLRTLDFLRQETLCGDFFSPVGCHGWYPRGKARASFDQQPINAGAMVEACLTAHQVTQQSVYADDALAAMGWFYGRNVHGLSLYDAQSGGCHDGLQCDGVNANQGAESTIVHLLAQLALLMQRPDMLLGQHAPAPETLSRACRPSQTICT